jgi:hypothetical protein
MGLKADDAARYGINNARPVRQGNTWIEKADEVVNILDILEAMGCDVPRGEYNSWKMFCPFKDEHADGGLDKNFRVYPPTNVNCFAMHGYMTPTLLYKHWKNMSRERAALILLEERGLLKNRNYRERWNELVDFRENERQTRADLGNQADLIDALTSHLRLTPNYKLVEFHPVVREAWRVVLTALDVLWSRPEVDLDKLQVWFERSKVKIELAIAEASQ